MKEIEAYNFYKKQHNMMKNIPDMNTLNKQQAFEIIEQVGKPFTTILELGAGNGTLARSLASFDKDITTVELVSEMVTFAKTHNPENVTALLGSFYDIEIKNTFDIILYIDGFGVGSDVDQLNLLKRIYNWLNDEGVCLIDIYQPIYWKKTAGQTMSPFGDSKITRVYGYDEEHQRMTDTWWENDKPSEKFTQSLACYTIDEIYALCQKANLTITAYYPGGAMNFENWTFNDNASLSECLSYRIKVEKA